jgi:Ca2+-binding RTX toxin-like protein
MLGLALASLGVPGTISPVAAAKVRCAGFEATKVGTDKSQVIRGTPRRDVIVAKGGNDRIFSYGGDDIICAGPGNDHIDAGAGRDRVFGGSGNDTLKGGAGRDLLDGGPGDDGCYPAAGGDRLVGCEDADLAVTIQGPTSVKEGATFEYLVSVRNVGARKSGLYDLVLTQAANLARCAIDHSGTVTSEALWPGAHAETRYVVTGGCARQPGTGWHVLVTALVVPTEPDADALNDQAQARIDLTAP